MTDDEVTAIEALRRAVRDPGRYPSHHYSVMMKHRHEWPTLWRAIDQLLTQSERTDESSAESSTEPPETP